jgi:hypothetical protein
LGNHFLKGVQVTVQFASEIDGLMRGAAGSSSLFLSAVDIQKELRHLRNSTVRAGFAKLSCSVWAASWCCSLDWTCRVDPTRWPQVEAH